MAYTSNDSSTAGAALTGANYSDSDWNIDGSTNNPMSLSLWVKTSADETQHIFDLRLASTPGIYLRGITLGEWTSLMTNETISVRSMNGRRCAWASTGATRNAFFDGNWHNIIATDSGSGAGGAANILLYLDGGAIGISQVWDGTVHSHVSQSDQATTIGFAGSTNGLNGSMAEIGFWNRVLTSGEIALLQYHSPHAVPSGRTYWQPTTNNSGLLLNTSGSTVTVGSGLSVSNGDHPNIIRAPILARRRGK